MGQPFTQQTITWDVVIYQQRIHAGLTEHQLLLRLPVILNPQKTMLILVQFADHSITEMDAHQATNIACAKPWLAFKEEGVEREFVQSEDSRTVRFRHGKPPVLEACR